MRRLTLNDFITRSIEIHKDKYDYSKVIYVNNSTPVIIHCNMHNGDFKQTPSNHLAGKGCPICNGGVKYTTDQFIKKAIDIHGNKFLYDRVNYVNKNTPVLIGCHIHGYIEQLPSNHLVGCGCPECSQTKRSNTEEFIGKAKLIHGNKYDYSKVIYVNNSTPVIIHCNMHNGDFKQTPSNHLAGKGCPICNGGVKYTTDQFIKKAIDIHGDLYTYDKVNYINCYTPVMIGCKLHGHFFQQPAVHLMGCGCPDCNLSKLEREVYVYCTSNNINYCMQHTWDWLINKSNQYVDFYLPDSNAVIECQGLQHFCEVGFFNSQDSFSTIVDRDNNKRNLCTEHGLRLFYFSNIFRSKQSKPKDFIYPYEVFEDIDEMFNHIILI